MIQLNKLKSKVNKLKSGDWKLGIYLKILKLKTRKLRGRFKQKQLSTKKLRSRGLLYTINGKLNWRKLIKR